VVIRPTPVFLSGLLQLNKMLSANNFESFNADLTRSNRQKIAVNSTDIVKVLFFMRIQCRNARRLTLRHVGRTKKINRD
jgi:hypothetical protein